MNAFQWIVCVTLAVALVRDLFPRRQRLTWALRVSRSLVWCTAVLAIANPLQVTRFANLIGIGRGADIVLYAVTLAFLAVSFYFYAEQLRLRRSLSKLAGHIALTSAQRGVIEQPNQERIP